MSRGVVLFAHNNESTDYYSMAVATASRVNKFLGLPVTVITDTNSVTDRSYTFDKTIFLSPDASNRRKNSTWINKGRYKVFEMSPYDETLVLDTDYMVNSTQLTRLFSYGNDFLCHNKTFWFGREYPQELLNVSMELGIETLWATVLYFKKTQRAQQTFQMIETVQNNYEHYGNIYGFLPFTYRNDYALTIAHKTVNGHLPPSEDFIPWNLKHVPHDVQVERDSDVAYTFRFQTGDKKNGYIKVSNCDFHMMSKTNFMELVK